MPCGSCGSRNKKKTWKDKRVAQKIAELPKTKANSIVKGTGICAKCNSRYPKKKLRAWGKELWCVNCVRLQRMKAKKL